MKEIIIQFKKNKDDTGSSEVQIISLTYRIKQLSTHLNTHKQDKHSKYGLIKMVNKRKKLLTYSKKRNIETYKKLINVLNLKDKA